MFYSRFFCASSSSPCFIFDFSVSYLKFKKPAALSVLETQNNQKHEKPKNKY